MAEPTELRWSSSAIVSTNRSGPRLRGDKITLPPSALEQLLSVAPSTRTSTSASLTAFDPRNPYAAAAFANNRSVYGETSQQLPNPLMFRLVNQANGNEVYAGIREFSAEEGHIGLSPFLVDALGLTDAQTVAGASADTAIDVDSDGGNASPRLTVVAKQLPKGTYVRLRPLEAGYNPEDWKSLLERELRDSYTTLTKNAILAVQGVRGEEFRFLVDKLLPDGDGVCVVDTDLEVDIEALNEEQARETMRQIIGKSQPNGGDGNSQGGELDIWKPVHGHVLLGGYVDYTLNSWDRSRPLAIQLGDIDARDEDVLDLLVSPRSRLHRSQPREDEYVIANWSPAENGSKRVVIQPTNVLLEDAEKLLISVHAWNPSADISTERRACSYTIRARSEDGSSNENGQAGQEMTQVSADDAQCKNCLQWVPKRTMILHENYCLRNNILCPQCKQVFQKSSEEWQKHWHCPHDDGHGNSETSKSKHDALYHTQRQCPACDFQADSLVDLASHRTGLCPGKRILCQFCHLEVPQEGDPNNPLAETILSGLTAHEIADGARTTNCHLCGKIVRLRDMAVHLKNHELDKATRPKPQICRNANCGRTLHGIGPRGALGSGTAAGQGPGNDLGLCSICFTPLYVSMHDPEGKALRRRIERRYLSQLMTGCGKKWCQNEWCKTGRANLGLEPKGAPTAAVKPLMADLVDVHSPLYFCVDETTQRRRALAIMLAGENAWDLEWCIAAMEAEGGNLDRAREWLANWAPARSA